MIREMKPGEEKALLGAARRAFIHSPLEQLGISKPKSALVAEVDGAVAGAMFLRVFGTGKKKTGYLDVGFVAKEYRGLGIGRTLYPAAVEHLRGTGCDHVAAMVIDDNVASWKSLENQGFGTPSLIELVRFLGFGRAMSLWLRTLFCIACGARLWIDGAVKKRNSMQELFSFLFVNLLLFLPAPIRLADRPDRLIYMLLAYPSVLLAGILFGGIGCLAAGGQWHIAFPRGGALLTLLLNSIGAVFPMVGRWYPNRPQATKECRRAMGIQAAVEWLGLIGVFSLGAFLLKDNLYLYCCATLAANLLVYRIIFFMPFGGGRVWGWSKILFAALVLVSAALIFLVF